MTGCWALRTGYRELVYAYPVPIPGQAANAVNCTNSEIVSSIVEQFCSCAGACPNPLSC